MTDLILNRRSLLESAAALVIGFAIPVRADESKALVSPFEAWIRIDANNQVTPICAHSEMGQGVMISLPMLLAEELDVAWANVRVQQAETSARLYASQGAGGSGSVSSSSLPLHQAAACARSMLVEAAAQRWRVSTDQCLTKEEIVFQ